MNIIELDDYICSAGVFFGIKKVPTEINRIDMNNIVRRIFNESPSHKCDSCPNNGGCPGSRKGILFFIPPELTECFEGVYGFRSPKEFPENSPYLRKEGLIGACCNALIIVQDDMPTMDNNGIYICYAQIEESNGDVYRIKVLTRDFPRGS